MAVAGYSVLTHLKSIKVIWVVPVIYAFVGGAEAFIGGSCVGGLYGPSLCPASVASG